LSKNVLVAGGAGFIGCNFVRLMVKRHPDWTITVLDNFSFSRPVNLADLSGKIKVIKGDISVDDDVKRAIKGKDIVVNFAAQTHVDRSIVDSKQFVMTQVLGTNNLLDAARNENVEKYLQVSTDEVYGEISEGSFKTNDPVNPRNPYAAAKCGADLLVRASWYTFGMPVLITRCSNNYGPFQHIEKFIPKTITSAIMGKKIPVYGSGEQVRDWIFVDDHCAGIETVLRKGKFGSVYHFASKTEMRNIDLVNLILPKLGKKAELMEHVKDRLGHDWRYSLDTTETKKLGWKPETSLEDGLKKTIAWYLENEKWWKTLLV